MEKNRDCLNRGTPERKREIGFGPENTTRQTFTPETTAFRLKMPFAT